MDIAIVKHLTKNILRASKTAPDIENVDGHLIVTRVFDDKVTISSARRRITVKGTLLQEIIENLKNDNVEIEELKGPSAS